MAAKVSAGESDRRCLDAMASCEFEVFGELLWLAQVLINRDATMRLGEQANARARSAWLAAESTGQGGVELIVETLVNLAEGHARMHRMYVAAMRQPPRQRSHTYRLSDLALRAKKPGGRPRSHPYSDAELIAADAEGPTTIAQMKKLAVQHLTAQGKHTAGPRVERLARAMKEQLRKAKAKRQQRR